MSDTVSPATQQEIPAITPMHFRALTTAIEVGEANGMNESFPAHRRRLNEIRAFLKSVSSGGTHALYDKRTQVVVEREELLGVIQAVELLQDALAERMLAGMNEVRESPNDWPAGQTWEELNSTSHAIFRQMARRTAGINDKPTFRDKIDDLYRVLDVDYETEPLAGWLALPEGGYEK